MYNDTEEYPDSSRGTKCINCGLGCFTHIGWRCPGAPNIYGNSKSTLPANMQYLTSDMCWPSSPTAEAEQHTRPTMPSPAPEPTSTVAPEPTPEWKVWRDINRTHMNCPCEIFMGDCKFHKHLL